MSALEVAMRGTEVLLDLIYYGFLACALGAGAWALTEWWSDSWGS